MFISILYVNIANLKSVPIEIFAEILLEKGISQIKLAMDLHLAQNSISRYENGTHEADYKTLIAIADYFNVSIDYLLERTDDPTFYRGR